MNFSKEEISIIIEILKFKNYENTIVVEDIFLKIIEKFKEKNKFEYTKENNQYIFSGENSLKYLRLISYTFEKLIDNNLLEISRENIENFSISFLSNTSQEINDFMILKLKNNLNSHIYITPELSILFEWNLIKTFLWIIFISLASIYFYLIYYLLKVFIRINPLCYLSILIVITIILGFKNIKNYKDIHIAFKYSYLNMEYFNNLLGFFGFLIAIISLFIA